MIIRGWSFVVGGHQVQITVVVIIAKTGPLAIANDSVSKCGGTSGASIGEKSSPVVEIQVIAGVVRCCHVHIEVAVVIDVT